MAPRGARPRDTALELNAFRPITRRMNQSSTDPLRNRHTDCVSNQFPAMALANTWNFCRWRGPTFVETL
jgi:hypothetical protein